MTMVNINDDLYKEVSKMMKNKELQIDYPTIQSFFNKSAKNQLRLEIIRIKELE